jgi:GH25 family lysozyme M1 (1,4-beta-N-acetylmuramidase)
MASMTPLVVDLSHHNVVTSFAKVYAAGIRGVIHKASEGTRYIDKDYLSRREEARKAGLLWGAYHFATGEDVETQVDHFLKTALEGEAPGSPVLLALDWEPEPAKGNTMSLTQARQFCALVAARTSQKPVLYSGHLLKEQAPKGDAFLSEHRLWLAQYASKAVLPAGFQRYFLWQYTGDGMGPTPHDVDGIQGTGLDLNVYGGTPEGLAAEWVADTVKSVALEPVVAEIPAPAVNSTVKQVSDLKGSRTVFGATGGLLAVVGAFFKDAIGVVMEAANQIELLSPAMKVASALGITTERTLFAIGIASLALALYAKLDDTAKGRVLK